MSSNNLRLSRTKRPWPVACGVALAATAGAFVLRMAFTPLIGPTTVPFDTFFLAVLVAAWFGGLWAGILSTVVSALASVYFFAEPGRSMLIHNRHDQLSLLIFIAVGLCVALLAHSQNLALDRAERAENAERVERRRFETTLSSIGDAVLATDAAGCVTFANKVALALVCGSEADVLGTHIEDVFRIINEFTREKVESPVVRVLRQGTVVGLANHTLLIARDGTEVPIDDSAAPIRGSAGEMVGVVLVFRDITERRAAEALRERQHKLEAEQALREKEAELARVARASAVGELGASIAHEVNQPLAGVATNADAALRWLSREPPRLGEATESLRLIARDAERAGAVVRRVRELLRKKESGANEPLDLNATIQEVLALARGHLEKDGVAVRTELAAGLPPVRGDYVALQQVIFNLLMNSSEAMAQVADGPRELVVCSRHSGPQVEVAVRDSGPGVDPASMGRMFKAFFTTKPGGMGMGLSICRSIIEAHGGRIAAESNDGPGLTVRFHLPATVEGTEAASTNASS